MNLPRLRNAAGATLGLMMLSGALANGAAAEPGGCLKYGAAGAVGGHLVHHGVLGAVGGCATGMYVRHKYRKREREMMREHDAGSYSRSDY